jgi:hypothetical protein
MTEPHENPAAGQTGDGGSPAERLELARRWRALTVSLLGAFMTLPDTSIVNVALPSIERDLGESGPLRPRGRVWTG